MRDLKQLPLASGFLVIVNVLVFLACMITNGQLYRAGILDIQGVLIQKEYGRIVWAMFLHGNAGHIFNNMLILFFLGAMIEKETGHVWLVLLYFLSGIGGNLLSLCVKALTGDMLGSIGASGAVFGLDGVLLSLVLFSGKKMESVTPVRVLLMILLSLYSGYSGGNIDNAAHIGGLLTGFGTGSIMCFARRKKILSHRTENGSEE